LSTVDRRWLLAAAAGICQQAIACEYDQKEQRDLRGAGLVLRRRGIAEYQVG